MQKKVFLSKNNKSFSMLTSWGTSKAVTAFTFELVEPENIFELGFCFLKEERKKSRNNNFSWESFTPTEIFIQRRRMQIKTMKTRKNYNLCCEKDFSFSFLLAFELFRLFVRLFLFLDNFFFSVSFDFVIGD